MKNEQMKNEERKIKKVRLSLLYYFFISYLFFFLLSCATTPAVPDELDMTLREVSDYLNESVPKGKKIAIVSVQSESAALTEYIIDTLVANAVNDRIFSVVDRQQLNSARAELNFNMSGEVSDQSAQAIGKMLGAQTIVIGKVSQIGDRYRINIRALETETAKLQGSNNWTIAAGKTISALLSGNGTGGRFGADAAGGATPYGNTTVRGRPGGAGGTAGTPGRQTVTKQAGPPNGTYTLYPRPQAADSGVPVKTVFLAQMVYTDEYTVIYFADKAQGSFENGIHGTSTYCWQEWKTLQLQDLDNPSKFYKPVNGEQSSNGGGAIWWISFKRLPVKRFKLVADSWQTLQTFYEVIVPDEPDKQ